MMQRSCTLLAAEFKQKSRWTHVRPPMKYGAMFLPFGVGRALPLSGCVWVTRDSNRMSNFSTRYAAVIADLDAAKNEADLNVPSDDVRWCDHRRLHFKCSTCGEPYRRAVSSAIKFHAQCSACKKRHTSEVLRDQLPGVPLSVARPDLAKQLAGEKAASIATFAASSKYEAKWSCACCKSEFRAPIRQRTGVVEAGQPPVSAETLSWSQFCESCRWEKNLAPKGREAIQRLDLLGLEPSVNEIAASAGKKIPRRRKSLFA